MGDRSSGLEVEVSTVASGDSPARAVASAGSSRVLEPPAVATGLDKARARACRAQRTVSSTARCDLGGDIAADEPRRSTRKGRPGASGRDLLVGLTCRTPRQQRRGRVGARRRRAARCRRVTTKALPSPALRAAVQRIADARNWQRTWLDDEGRRCPRSWPLDQPGALRLRRRQRGWSPQHLRRPARLPERRALLPCPALRRARQTLASSDTAKSTPWRRNAAGTSAGSVCGDTIQGSLSTLEGSRTQLGTGDRSLER